MKNEELIKLLQKEKKQSTVAKVQLSPASLELFRNSVLASIMTVFKYYKNIPLIPPLFHENNFATDFKEKVELFNSFLTKQCF